MKPEKHAERTAARRRELLAAAGLMMFGKEWVDPMAYTLRRSRKTVWRWKNGLTHIQSDIEYKLLELLRDHRSKTSALIAKISDFATEQCSGAGGESFSKEPPRGPREGGQRAGA